MLNKLYRFLSGKKSDKNSVQPLPIYNHSITVGLTNDSNIEIIIDNKFIDPNVAFSMLEAEKFAELLFYISTISFTKKIINILETKANKTHNANEKLFIDNILVCYKLIEEEFDKKTNNNEPIIRPSAVFNPR